MMETTPKANSVKRRPSALPARLLRRLNALIVLLWRLGLGPWFNFWPALSGRILILVHSGRKSGKRHLTPLNYALLNGEIYCVTGFGPTSDWYRNLLANPQVELWLPDGWWVGLAEEIVEPVLREEALKAVRTSGGLIARLFGAPSPREDETPLSSHTAPYRVIRLRRVAPRTGTHGPGDLAWVWPLITLWVWLRARRGRRRV
ncbi:nitroreductase family deazaflavin-dependent oxidoreductase [uncultured Thermanaerothrix sp.]|uniref:nitroreductase family deazaflavin-dependent oxidoreductase n=1 Tax=uncultured Thermanaerothrix sp. TaxID=1195149 RepID=UPI002606291E|nr:nitroreductase family deazaflavin-dependent oxidoreductase [uncultured Thermanaerothrix sp.]